VIDVDFHILIHFYPKTPIGDMWQTLLGGLPVAV
jgi:hypothetical protein